MLSVVFIVDAIVFDSLKLALTLFFGLIFFSHIHPKWFQKQTIIDFEKNIYFKYCVLQILSFKIKLFEIFSDTFL